MLWVMMCVQTNLTNISFGIAFTKHLWHYFQLSDYDSRPLKQRASKHSTLNSHLTVENLPKKYLNNIFFSPASIKPAGLKIVKLDILLPSKTVRPQILNQTNIQSVLIHTSRAIYFYNVTGSKCDRYFARHFHLKSKHARVCQTVTRWKK